MAWTGARSRPSPCPPWAPSPASRGKRTTRRCSSTSFAYPLTPFRYDFKTGKSSEFAHVDAKVDASAYQVKQAWYPSRDGTKVPMFVVHRKGLSLDGRRPTVLY